MKECKKCKIVKSLTEFCKASKNKDGLMSYCKLCESERKRSYRLLNKTKILEKKHKYYLDNKQSILDKQKLYSNINEEKIKERRRNYYLKNKETIKQKTKTYRENNSDKYKEYLREYNKENREYLSESKKEYYIKNKDRFTEYRKNNKDRKNKWACDRMKNDICFKMRLYVSIFVREALKKQGKSKNNPTWSKLPYTPQQLKGHLESQFDSNMTWDNYGLYWNIDHIYPQSKLLYDSLDHPNFLKCWSLNNLRPLEKIENIKKSNKVLVNASQQENNLL